MLHEAAPIRQQHPGCPSGLLLRWQQDSYQQQPHAPAPRLRSCLQELGNLLPHRKRNPKNVSCHFGNPSTVELPEPYGRNYFFMPVAVQNEWTFQWIIKQTFVCFFLLLLYFNNRLQKMQGTSLLENIFPLHLSTTKDC